MQSRSELCGAPTRAGSSCRRPKAACSWHGGNANPAAPGNVETSANGPRALPVPSAVTERDLRKFSWWLAAKVLRAELEPQRASVLATLVRVLASLGPDPMSEREALAEVELRGLLMHGIPPKNAEQWARAEAIFAPETLAEIERRFALFGDGQGDYVRKPLLDREAGAGQADVPFVVDVEDGS